MSPGQTDENTTKIYQCSRVALLAHATAYHIYDDEFRAKQGGFVVKSSVWQRFNNFFLGKITMVTDSSWFEPISNSTQDLIAWDREMQLQLGTTTFI